jgi:Tol biopolymer transport system component
MPQRVKPVLASADVAGLANGALKTMFPTKLKIATVALLAVGLGAARAGALAQPPAEPPKEKQAAPPAPAKDDAAPGQPSGLPLPGHKGAVRAVAFAPDGKAVATTGADGTVRVWDHSTGQETLKLELPGEGAGVAFSPDGKTLAAASRGKAAALLVWDISGKEIWRSAGRNAAAWAGAVTFSPDGSRIVAGAEDGGVVVFDAPSGKMVIVYQRGQGGGAVACSPDGKLLVGADGGGNVHLLASRTGKLVRVWQCKNAATSLTFLPDGTKVAVVDGGKAVRMLDMATGQEGTAFQGDDAIQAVAFSPDGKQAVTAGKGGEVVLWDAAQGTEARRFDAGQGALNAVAFAPDGQGLATAGEDGTAVVWDLTRDEKPLARDVKLTEKDLAGLWDDLAADGGGKVYAAQRTLRADPARAVPFLRERLKPHAEGPDDKKIERLIADLGADDFDVRERATKDLEQLGKNAESALRVALADSPDPEVRMRTARLLKGIGEVLLTAEQRRDVRAVRVLEQACTPEARALLEKLTEESPGWWVTVEAKAALQRMDRRNKKP